MKAKRRLFVAIDILYICMMVLPLVAGLVIRILTAPATEGISITGAQILFTIPMPIQDLLITEAQINSWLVMISITGLCLYLSHGLRVRNVSNRQHLAEWIVESVKRQPSGARCSCEISESSESRKIRLFAVDSPAPNASRISALLRFMPILSI